jgi:signal transduction histidine kinase
MSQQQDLDSSHRMARLIRHEVGDLLQSVYSTVAVLLERLPAEQGLERRLLSDLKNRAELCRSELDAVVDLAGPTGPAEGRADLDVVFAQALAQVRKRHPALELTTQSPPAVAVAADARALSAATFLLLTATCQAAKQRVRLGFSPSPRHVDCWIERDGYPASPEQLAWLEAPFATTQHAAFGLGLALTRWAVAGGEVEARNVPDGGVIVRIRFPVWAEARGIPEF